MIIFPKFTGTADKMKKILSLLIIISIICIHISIITASSRNISGEYEYIVENGYAIIRGTIDISGDIVIPEQLDGYPVTGIGSNTINTNSISFKNKLTSVVLPNSLQFIGYGSFKDCTLLKSVTIPDSVVFIRPDAFKNCTSLASITIPDSVTTIDNDAFKGCTSLKEVSIPNTVIDIGPYIFGGCTNITKVTIDSNAIGVGMFYGCISLTTVNIGDNVEFIGAESFVGCESLDSIIIPDSVQYIDHAVFIGSNISSIIFYNPNTVFEEGIDEVFTIYPRGPTDETQTVTISTR